MDNSKREGQLMANKSYLAFLGAFFVLIFIILLIVINVATQVDDIEEQLKYASPQKLAPAEPLETDERVMTAYVPVYSHIYAQGGKPQLLEVTLSIRNIDPEHPITINAIRYYSTNGELLNSYLESPVVLAPLSTSEILVEQDKVEGGSGANFLVEWFSNQAVNTPIIEAIMIGGENGKSISFVRPSVPLNDK